VSAPQSYAPQKACWATFVLAHGAGAGQHHAFVVQTARALASEGVAVTTFDFPYMAEGRRVPDRLPRLISAFAAMVDGAHRAHPSLPVFVGGKSMGGRVATHVAVDPPSALPALAGVVALGYPLRPPTARRVQDRVSHLRRLPQPLLVVQGTRDAFGGPDAITDAFAACGVAACTVVAVPDADHGLCVPVRGPIQQAESDRHWQQAVLTWMRARVPELRPSSG
jgi:predicted alpha/beta-hydrolase family hydrolase